MVVLSSQALAFMALARPGGRSRPSQRALCSLSCCRRDAGARSEPEGFGGGRKADPHPATDNHIAMVRAISTSTPDAMPGQPLAASTAASLSAASTTTYPVRTRSDEDE